MYRRPAGNQGRGLLNFNALMGTLDHALGYALAALRRFDEAEEENEARTFGIPFASMMLLFMLIMVSAPQLMNQVLEEKMQRISEVLVSAEQ